jgi:hypothetical protein
MATRKVTRENKTKTTQDTTRGQDALSSQDPAEGRPDVPKGQGADKGRKYDTDKYFHDQKPIGRDSNEDPAEGRR